MLWWVILTGMTGVWRERFSARGILMVNRIAGGVMIGFGMFTIVKVLL